MKFRALLVAGLVLCWASSSLAQNQLPAIQGPGGPIMAQPVVNIGYDTGTGLPCVVGKVTTCVLSAGGGGGGGGFPADVASTGNSLASTLNSAYTVPLANGEGVTGFVVTGLTASGATITIEASDDGGTTWAAVNGVAPQTGVLFSTLTSDQQFRVNTGGRSKVRLRVSTAGSGTITVSSIASSVSTLTAMSSPLPPGGNPIGSVVANISATTSPPTWTNGSTTNQINGNTHGGIRFIPGTPAGVDFDLSAPAAIAGADGTNIASTSNPVPTQLQTGSNTVGTVNLGTISTAATAAKQPALGTAGTPSVDVITVQGSGSGTALPISVASLPALPANQSMNEAQINGVAPLMGNGVTGTGSQRVTIASDNTPFTVNTAQSGTWTVQPGNTANTTAWKVDGSAVTQPVSGTVTANAGSGTMAVSAASLPLPSGAATEASVSGLSLSQGGSTSGQKGVLVQCAALTTATTVTTATINSPSCDAANGAFRTDIMVGTTPVNGSSSGSDTVSNSVMGLAVYSRSLIFDGTNFTRLRQAVTGTNSTGVGLPSAQVMGECDDVSQTALTEGSFGNARISCTNHAMIVRPYETAANSWSYAAASGGISNTTTAVTVHASCGAGLKNYISGLQLSSDALGAATELVLRDGASGTVVWRGKVQTAGVSGTSTSITPPISGTAATLLEAATLTATVTGGVYLNAQGFCAP